MYPKVNGWRLSEITFLISILLGRETMVSAKEAAKGAGALESDGQTNIGDGTISLGQQFLCPLQAQGGQELMRALLEDLLERSQKVARRETGRVCHVSKRQALAERGIDIISGPVQSTIKLFAGRGSQSGERFDLFMYQLADAQTPGHDVMRLPFKPPST